MKTKLELYEPTKGAEKVTTVKLLFTRISDESFSIRGISGAGRKNLLELRTDGIYVYKNVDEDFGLPLDSAGRLKLVGAPSVSTSLEMLELLKEVCFADEAMQAYSQREFRNLIAKAQAEIDGKDGRDG